MSGQKPGRQAAATAFSDALRVAITNGYLTQQRIAALLGVQDNTVSKWINHNSAPKLTGRSVSEGLVSLDQAAQVAEGTFPALYRAVTEARVRVRSAALDDPYLGLTRVHSEFPMAGFSRRVREAQRVRIVNTWLPNLNMLSPALKQALSAGCSVDIALLHPFLPAAMTRASTLGPLRSPDLPHSIAGEILQTIQQLSKLAESLGGTDLLNVSVYPQIPAMAIFSADDYFLVSNFWHGWLAISGPQFEIEDRDSVMAAVIHHEIEAVADSSRGPIQLVRWREWLSENIYP